MQKKSSFFSSIFFPSLLFGLVSALAFSLQIFALSKKANLTTVVLGTDWLAQAEHGGFYQAVADGTYQKYGLDVQIKMGGPQVNGVQMLLANEIQFFMPPATVVLLAADKKLPLLSVAAIFQKDLGVLMAHPNAGNDSFEKLKGKPIFISPTTAAAIWGFLSAKYGYTDDQKIGYSHSLIPFLKDKSAIQEGIITSEPYVVEKEGHFKPVVLALSDAGLNSYGEILTCTKKYEQENSVIVKKFVQASIEGWKHYLKDPSLGNKLIQKDNPQMPDDLLTYAWKELKAQKIIEGRDAEKYGIGAMTDKGWSDFYNDMLKVNSLPKNIDVKSIYTLKYLIKGL